MKRTLFTLSLLGSTIAFAQEKSVGINTETPKTTLQVVGDPINTNHFDGFMAPSITGEQLKAKTYTAEQTGALVFITSAVADTHTGQTINVTSPGYYYFDGSVWIRLKPLVYTAGSGIAISNTNEISRTGFEEITEDGKTGWRLIGRNPNHYGNIGTGALDASVSDGNSDTRGATGNYSVAIGYNSTASGEKSFAGTNSTAEGRESIAMGRNARAVQDYSIALGYAEVNSINSIAIGNGSKKSTISANNSFSFGSGNTILGTQYNYAIGMENKIGENTLGSFVFGKSSTISKNGSYSFGENNTVSNSNSYVIGKNSTVSGQDSYTLGENNTVSNSNSYVIGKNSTASRQNSYSFGYQTKALGNNSYAIGYQANATGDSSYSIGYKNNTTGNYALSLGANSTAGGNFSFALGQDARTSNGSSYSIGYQTNTEGLYSFAFGYQAKTAGQYAFSIGYQTNAKDYGTFALGSGVTATSQTPLVIGRNQHTIAMASNGNVGIGLNANTPATEKLEVNGNVKVNGAIQLNNSSITAEGYCSNNGAIGFSSNSFYGCIGNKWKKFTMTNP